MCTPRCQRTQIAWAREFFFYVLSYRYLLLCYNNHVAAEFK